MGNRQLLDTATCFHCGETCKEEILPFDNHPFCCKGCLTVYQLLSNNNLCGYYDLENTPGIQQRNPVLASAYTYLDDEKIMQQLLTYKDENIAKVIFFIPTMHCSSCIWLLEHFYKLDPSITNARVQFMKKELHISYNPKETSLRKIVTLLSSLGYEPAISLNDLEKRTQKDDHRKLSYQIGVAGFCFGNIMLISFPEYFGLDSFTQGSFSKLFGYINLVLSLPVFLFSAQDYFIAAWKGIRSKFISIDIPLALGIFVMFARSTYEVVSGHGIGWFDTHAGLVFFLLIGKWFQQKTFNTLSFERDYKSYFPIAVTVLRDNTETTLPVTSLSIGDRILIRNNELIPADAILLNGDAHIDFSFVTGESDPIRKVLGEIIYAGGRQIGHTIELEVCKKVSQSYLTQLWNNDAFAKDQRSSIESFQQLVSRYFTIALLTTAFVSAGWWLLMDPSLALNAFTAVLIIACPCALALSSPFALGTAMRILGKHQFYIKSPQVVEQLAHMDAVVFDKTGTLTQPSAAAIHFQGKELTSSEKQIIASVVSQSIHPLSQKIKSFLAQRNLLPVSTLKEITGKGLSALVNDQHIIIGSAAMANIVQQANDNLTTKVYVTIDGKVLGYFQVDHSYRDGLENVIETLRPCYDLYLLSGDNEKEKTTLLPYFKNASHMHFKQLPADKLSFIQQLQSNNKKVIMIGDGLNDAGALKAANMGISITESTSHFSPASDVIMSASMFEKLPAYLAFSKNTLKVIHASFIISLIYNIVGLSFAIQGTLSPLIAAVLMPLSSVTVIAFTTISTTFISKKGGL
ncbi:MAG TPA: heavy metal translocating P-type ATPase [Bacteroidetes bacterium]|nr:heavy metal translocating P-type ATPase [Bacteroidota bacterium]